MYSVDTKLVFEIVFKYYEKYLYLYLNIVLNQVFAIVFVFGKFIVFVFVFKYHACNVFGPKSDWVHPNNNASFTLSRNTDQAYVYYAHLASCSVLKLRSYNRATNSTSQAMKNFNNNNGFCFKEVKGAPAIAKEITKGW